MTDGFGSLGLRIAEVEEKAADVRTGLVALVRHLGECGVLRLCVPKDFGGEHESLRAVELCRTREFLAHASPLADLAFAMQGLGSYPITYGGSDAQKRAWLPKVAAGTAIAAFAITERDAGSDLGNIELSVRLDGDHYVLNGEKIFISNAGLAHFYVTYGATAPKGERRRLTALIVEADTRGLSIEPWHVLGDHPIGALRFDNVRVPVSSRLMGEGDGISIALATLTRFRPTVGAAAVGLAQRALDESVHHVKERKQFGAALSANQAVQMKLADMACDVEASRLLVARAAQVIDDNGDRANITRTGSMAKLVATESAQRVIDHAVQLHGGRGVLKSSIVAQLYEDIRALRIYEGSSDIHRMLIARELLGGTAGS